jgi:tRNA pseudouridine55 synthase
MDGVIVIDKPSGWTSHDVVAKIRNLTRIKKVGHTGTLDPFATGVLPLTLGRATRLTNYFLSCDKVYRGVMRFGFATTTFDLDGEPSGQDTNPELDQARLEEICSRFTGRITQTIPPYSAKKVQGKPMYAYARKGIDMGEVTKTVHVQSLRVLGVDKNQAEFELVCASGTYARSLAHDMGKEYGCGAHLVQLRRTRSGEFPIESAVPMGDGTKFHPREYFLERIIPMHNLLGEIPAIVLSDGDKARLAHGMDLSLLTSAYDAYEWRLLDENGNLLALARRVEAFTSPLPQPAQWVRAHPHLIFAP